MMRFICAALAVAASTSLEAQQQAPFHPDSAPPRSVSLDGTVKVPLVDPGIPGSTLPVIEVMVNGKGPFRFGVETGAGFVGGSSSVAEAAGLTLLREVEGISEYRVDSVTFGGAAFRGLTLSVASRSPTGVDGILGLPFFRDALVTIDYGAKELRLSRDTLPVANGVDILSLTRTGPFWSMPIALGGSKHMGVLDTRSTATLSMSPDAAERVTFESPLAVVGRSRGAGLPEAEVRAGTLAGDAKLGAFTFPRPTMTVRTLPPQLMEVAGDVIVGDGVLRNFVVSLDQRNARLRLAREGDRVVELPRPQSVRQIAGSGGQPAAPRNAPTDAVQSALAEFTGRYGDRQIFLQDGKLHIQRPNGRALEMIGAGSDAFTLAQVPGARLQFTRDSQGKVDAIRVLTPSGEWETARRG